MIAQNEINVQERKTDNRTVSDEQPTGRILTLITLQIL